MTYRSFYEDRIREEVARQGRVGVDPRHVEAYMRLEHSTLDGLSWGQFQREVALALACIDVGGRDRAEQTANSFGL